MDLLSEGYRPRGRRPVAGAVGATCEALIAAFCRREKSLSCCREKGWLVGAVGVEPTTFGLKDQNRAQPLQPATVTYRRISHLKHSNLLSSGVVVCGYPHKSRTIGPTYESQTVGIHGA